MHRTLPAAGHYAPRTSERASPTNAYWIIWRVGARSPLRNRRRELHDEPTKPMTRAQRDLEALCGLSGPWFPAALLAAGRSDAVPDGLVPREKHVPLGCGEALNGWRGSGWAGSNSRPSAPLQKIKGSDCGNEMPAKRGLWTGW